jgi:hypothetical protein
MSVPNTLTIYLNTRIPGHQRILYKPSMTNPKIDKNMSKVYFNPLVKLTKSVINDVPPNIVKNQFFDKGLFYTLESRVLTSFFGQQKLNEQPELLRFKLSKENGTMDKNIRLTLNTLFKPNSIIYIDKKPYTIYSYSWDNNTWKMDTNINLPSFLGNFGMGMSPFGYRGSNYGGPIIINNIGNQRSVYSIENSLANKELKKIPLELVAGDDYDEKELADIPTIHPLSWSPNIPTVQMIENNVTGFSNKQPLLASAPPIPVAKPLYPALPAPQQPTTQNLALPAPQQPTTQNLALPAPQQPTNSNALVTIGGALTRNKMDTNQSYLRKYFKDYYKLLKVIYKKLPKEFKLNIQPPKKQTRTTPLQDLNQSDYNNLVNKLEIKNTTPNGNCFFESIAIAINSYNSYEKNKIEYKGKVDFQQNDIREMVVDYFNKYPEKLNEVLENAKGICEQMNDELNNNGNISNIPISQEKIESIYNNYYNFLILRPDDSKKGGSSLFQVVKDPYEYIKSDKYWGDDLTIQIIEDMIGLKVFVILSDDRDNISFPFPNLIEEKKNPFDEKWSKYVYVYFKSKHYDLVTFDKKAIYNLSDQNVIDVPNMKPPLYIILFMYGFYYIKIKDPDDRNKIELFLVYFTLLNEIYEDILDNIYRYDNGDTSVYKNKDEYNVDLNFIDNFKHIFNPPPFVKPIGLPNITPTNTTNPTNPTTTITTSSTIPPQLPSNVPTTTVMATPNQVGITGVTEPQTSSIAAGVSRNYTSPISTDTRTTFIISIDLELYPGTEIPTSKKISLGCNRNFEGIRKAYAELRGFVYRPIPLNYYDSSVEKNINRSFKSQTLKNKNSRENKKKGGKTYKNRK